MSRRLLVKSMLLATMTAAFWTSAYAEQFVAHLDGFEEVPAAIFSAGTGDLALNLNQRAQTITYTLSYAGLGSPVLQAHIHFGKVHVAGGIMVFLCSNLGNGPAGTPACPSPGGTVTGTLTPGGVAGPVAQSLSAGDFDAVVEALRSNTAYANVHTQQFTSGEIRGQVVGEDDDEQ